MAPVAVTPPPIEAKQIRPGFQRANTANMGTKRKIICFSGIHLFLRPGSKIQDALTPSKILTAPFSSKTPDTLCSTISAVVPNEEPL